MTAGGAMRAVGPPPPPDERLVGAPRCVMLDVDGTLAPIVSHPSLAEVPAATRRAVADLVALPDAIVALVSGRAAADARRMVDVPGVWTIGNHGAEIVDPEGGLRIEPDVARHAEAVAEAARRLAPLVAPLAGVLLEDKRWTLSIHYRLADPEVEGPLRAAVAELAGALGLRLAEGKRVLELRPPVEVHKGTAIHRLAGEIGALRAGALLLYAGDDTTDEDAFRLLRERVPGATTVFVGGEGRATAAEFRVADPAAVRELLERIARLARAPR